MRLFHCVNNKSIQMQINGSNLKHISAQLTTRTTQRCPLRETFQAVQNFARNTFAVNTWNFCGGHNERNVYEAERNYRNLL